MSGGTSQIAAVQKLLVLGEECAVMTEVGKVRRPKIILGIGILDEDAESKFALMQGLYGQKDP